MTPEQTTYMRKVTIAGLGGGLAGALVGQYASEPPTMGKTILGVVLGAAMIGAGYGIFLRTGGDPSAAMLGLGRMNYGLHRGPGAAAGSFGGFPRNFQLGATPGYRYTHRRRPGYFAGLGMTLKPGQCMTVG